MGHGGAFMGHGGAFMGHGGAFMDESEIRLSQIRIFCRS